jgi:hypothetical protein
MKKNGSRSKASVEKKIVRKILNMPFCAYCVQMSTTFAVFDRRFLNAFELNVRLDKFDSAVCARRHACMRP